MTIPAEFLAPILIAMTAVFSGWMIYEHRRVSETQSAEVATLARTLESASKTSDLTHAFEGHDGRIAALEVPHEHGKHTHELVTASRHQEGGHLVLVKMCILPGCKHVFRDAQD